MNRREFLAVVGGTIATIPVVGLLPADIAKPIANGAKLYPVDNPAWGAAQLLRWYNCEIDVPSFERWADDCERHHYRFDFDGWLQDKTEHGWGTLSEELVKFMNAGKGIVVWDGWHIRAWGLSKVLA